MKRLFLILFLLLTTGCAARIAKMSGKQRSERLATERGRLPDITDPVERTKSYITISDILLSFTSDAISDGATGDVKTLIDQYVMALQSARDTMATSKRDAQRRPAGYKDLEVTVRGQLRVLQDISKQLPFDQRGTIEDAIAVATSVRDEMLKILFPKS